MPSLCFKITISYRIFNLQFVHKKVLELQGTKKDKKEYKKHSKRPIMT